MLQDAISELPERMQIAVRGFLDNRTMEDIGSEIGVTKQAVNHLQKGAFERIRKKFGEQGVASSGALMSRGNKSDDTRYIDLAKDPEGNKDELRRMVDARAVEAGYTPVSVYHGTHGNGPLLPSEHHKYRDKVYPGGTYEGTREGDFTEFDSSKNGGGLIFFSADREFAHQFQANYADTDATGRIVSAYLDAKNLWDFRSKEDYDKLAGELTGDAKKMLLSTPPGSEWLWRAVETPEAAKALKALGYDGVRLAERSDIHDNGAQDSTDTIGVFSPSQVKSSEAITRDADGEIIPLSERFNPETDNILHARANDATGHDNEIDSLIADLSRAGKLDWRDVILEKESARLENPNGDAFAVPSLASPGTMTLRQLFGGVNSLSSGKWRESPNLSAIQ